MLCYFKHIVLLRYKYSIELITEDKFSVNTSSTFTILKIKSLNLMDAGVYTVVAKNRYITERLNFTLKVTGIQIIFENKIKMW